MVQPNPRVYKALKTQMDGIYEELQRIAQGDDVADDILDTIDLITVMMKGLKGDESDD